MVIATKVGGVREPNGSWDPAFSAAEIEQHVHANLEHLRLDVLDVVNLRVMFDPLGLTEGSIEAPLTALAEMQRRGLVRHIGLSNLTAAQVAEGRKLVEIVCVQNLYNIAHRHDDALIDELAASRIAYVPFFPLGGFSPLQSSALNGVASRLGATPTRVALAWLPGRAPDPDVERRAYGVAQSDRRGPVTGSGYLERFRVGTEFDGAKVLPSRCQQC